MKTLAFASVGGVLVALLTVSAGLAGCWHLAPDGGTLPDGSADGTTDALLVDGTNLGDGMRLDGAGLDGGDGGDGPVESGPVQHPYASAAIAAGLGFGCVVSALGQVSCWGDNTYGQAGGAPGGAPVAHPQIVPVGVLVGTTGAPDAGDAGDMGTAGDAGILGLPVTAIALGDHHACAIASSQVYCWGLNAAYQLGHTAASDGDQICPGSVAGQTVPCSGVPALVAGIDSAVAISAAGASTCVVTSGQTVTCWGASQIPGVDGGVPCGLGTQAQGGSCFPAVYAVAVSNVTQLAVAYDHACATLAGPEADASDTVACWGSNNEAQVSPSACPSSDCVLALPRSDLVSTTGLAAGTAFSCALDATGVVRCFGDNTYGQLGHAPGSSGDFGSADLEAGLGIFNPTALPVGSLGTSTTLVGGGNESACALVSGAVDCWGNVSGSTPGTPVAIAGLPTIAALGSYAGVTACGLAEDGGIWCWSTATGSGAAQVQ